MMTGISSFQNVDRVRKSAPGPNIVIWLDGCSEAVRVCENI